LTRKIKLIKIDENSQDWLHNYVENSCDLKLYQKNIASIQVRMYIISDWSFSFWFLFSCNILYFTKNYHTKFLKSFQNLMNQHDHKYFIIQHAVTHADKLWQILDREKICLELKEKKIKIQQHNENFNQHCHNNFRLQNQNKKWWSFY